MSIKPTKDFKLVIHGGATNNDIDPQRLTHMKEVLETAGDILTNGGSATDAVVKAVQMMEDSSLYNAGRGSIATDNGVIEQDAAIMSGQTGIGASVACLKEAQNPITAAKLVMEKHGSYKFLAGDDGVKEFLGYSHNNPNGLDIIENRSEHFVKLQQPQDTTPKTPAEEAGNTKGTVGAVALDQHGNLAAATSTGGAPKKQLGRVGDTPIIGAGTLANKQVAISCTGIGEHFIRANAAADISAQIEYTDKPLEKAANHTLDKVEELGGWGGMIAIDKDGNVSMPYRCNAMYRGSIDQTGKVFAAAENGPN